MRDDGTEVIASNTVISWVQFGRGGKDSEYCRVLQWQYSHTDSSNYHKKTQKTMFYTFHSRAL